MQQSDDPLARACQALEQGRGDDAHEALAAAWRERRSPVLAELAELADLRSPTPMRARLDALAAPRAAVMLERVRALEGVDDPLWSTWVLGALESPPFTGPSSRPLLEALLDAAERLRDPRLVDRAPAIARVWEARVTPKPSRVALASRLAQIASAVAASPPRDATEDEARLESTLAARLRPVASSRRTFADLLADVYADPVDDAPRLVLADFLLERGDPRGELIALQFKRRDGELYEAGAARERELLKKHGKEWLGPLAPVISWGKGYAESRFERGFLAIADIILSAGKKIDLVLDEPSWAVVEELRGAWPDHLLYRAPLRGLRVLRRGQAQVLDLAERKLVFPNVHLLETSEGVRLESLAEVFPSLRTLSITFKHGPLVEDVAAVLSLPVQRVVFQRWISGDDRPSAMPFDALVEGVLALPATIPEIALEPPWRGLPRPDPVELRAAGGRYERVSTPSSEAAP